VVGENKRGLDLQKKLLIFPLSEVPELAKGQGVYLQRYKDGELIDATTFTWKEGLRSENGKHYSPSEIKDFKGERAQTGRVLPKGWARTGKLAP
jgi:topoisomerase-4 subunit A